MNTSVVRAKILWSRLKVFGTIGPNNSTGGVQFTSTMVGTYTTKTFLLFIIYRGLQISGLSPGQLTGLDM